MSARSTLDEELLHVAASEGNEWQVRRLIERGHDINKQGKSGRTPLHEAVEANRIGVVKLLLSHEMIMVDVKDEDGCTPLHLACADKPQIARLLLEQNAQPSLGNNTISTPLHIASKYHNVEIINMLLNKNVTVDAHNDRMMTPLMCAICEYVHGLGDNTSISYNIETVKVLLNNGANVHSRNHNGDTPLCMAVLVQWVACVEFLLERGANVNERSSSFNYTPLLIAIQESSESIVKLLLKYGANANIETPEHILPLHLVLRSTFPKVSLVKAVLDSTNNEAIIRNSVNRSPYNAISISILALDTDISDNVRLIMDRDLGSSIDQAPIRFWKEMIPLLQLTFGLHNYATISPLSYLLCQKLVLEDSYSLVELFIQKGSSVNAHDKMDVPPLVALVLSHPPIDFLNNIITVQNNKLPCFKRLMEEGCNVDGCTNDYGIPDAILAATTHSMCCSARPLLQPLLNHCLSWSVDGLLAWLMTHRRSVSLPVVSRMLGKSTMDAYQLKQLWNIARPCTCTTCERHVPAINAFIDSKPISSLQALCRNVIRKMAYDTTHSSLRARKLIISLCLPVTVKKYILSYVVYDQIFPTDRGDSHTRC